MARGCGASWRTTTWTSPSPSWAARSQKTTRTAGSPTAGRERLRRPVSCGSSRSSRSNPRRRSTTSSGRSGSMTITCSSWDVPPKIVTSSRLSSTSTGTVSSRWTALGMFAPTSASTA